MKNVKKMFSKNDKDKNFKLVHFTPPKRHDGKQSYISFCIQDPVSGKMRRKKYMLDRFAEGVERDMMAAQIIATIFTKLMQGWNPWMQAETIRGDILLTKIIANYRIYLKNLVKKKIIKEKTCIDWNSRARILENYLQDYHRENVMAYQINRSFVVDYLDYILFDRDVSTTTRNNHRAWFSTFCNWMVEKCYIDENPVGEVPFLAERAKFREPLPPAALKKLSKYLKEHDKYFLLAVMMEYYTFIRPTELTKIRLRDISIKSQTVFISSAISKNRKDGMVALNDKIVKLMIELNIFTKPGHFFLFGRRMMPSELPTTAAVFRLHFLGVRQALNFPSEYQFYSLKDSGIRDLANSQGIVVARDQARHADISTTNKYLQGKDQKVNEGTKHFKGNI